MPRDFLPTNWAAFAAWILNFATYLPTLAAKYGILPDKVATVQKASDWAQYYVPVKVTAAQQEKQLTDYMSATRKRKKGDKGIPTKPIWELPADAPADIAPDLDDLIREIANQIKNQKSIYTLADGELLGIVTGEETGKPESEYFPTLEILIMAAYHVGFTFRKLGLDAVRFEFRRKGGAWMPIGDSAISPTDFMIQPETPGEAEQIEIRAIFLKDYKPFGVYSPIYTATIAP